jgi:hypothetical protein
METVLEMAARGFQQMIGRLSGPLNFRLFVMPTVVTILAIRAGLKDAREGKPPILTRLISTDKRRRLIRSALKDVGKVFIVAVVLDTFYQLFVLREFHPLQTLFVAVACAIMPYVLIRFPATHLARGWYRKEQRSADKPLAEITPNPIQKRGL